jgi:hypothetical protein
MEIELLVVSDCPHRPAAVDLLRTALVDIGMRPEFRVVTVNDDENGSFTGSPTFRADGDDLFPTTGQRAGLSCRLYHSGPTGGLPELPALRQALKQAADRARTASTA